MGVTYLPAGYSDSEDEDDFLDDKPRVKPKSAVSGGWLSDSLQRTTTKDEQFDQDIKEVMMSRDLELVKEMVEDVGLDVNHHLKSAYGWSLSLFAASLPDPDLLSWLVTNGGLISVAGGDPCPAMVALASTNQRNTTDKEIIKTAEIIISTGEDPNSTQNQGKTPLMLAASYGNLALVEFLIRHGSKLDITDSQGWSALMFSSDGGHGATVLLLLEAGADPDLVTHEGQRAADLATSTTLQAVIEQFAAHKSLGSPKQVSCETEERQKEMENILFGLDLEEYKDTFNMHKIGVEEFLTLSEESMISMGLEKVGARSRLLEGQVEAHKRTWEKGSMPRLRLTDKKAGLRLTCPDAAGVLGNLSNHSSYLRASVSYIRLQLRNHGPRLMQAGSDVVPPGQLLIMLENCTSRVVALERELSLLSREFVIAGAGTESLPPDTVPEVLGQSSKWVGPKTALLLATLVPASMFCYRFLRK